MRVEHCKRCDRDWTFNGTGRPLRCGKCKTPYWDIPRQNGNSDLDEVVIPEPKRKRVRVNSI